MAKFSFNKLRTAVLGFLGATDQSGTSLAAGEEAIYVPKMRSAYIVEDITVATTLTNEDSGKIFMLDSAAGAYEITLPVAANLESGWNCKFVTKEDTPTADITIAAGSAIIDFAQKDAAGDAGASTAGTAVSNILVEAASKQGDYISIFTDGTSYYAHGLSGVATGHTTS